MAMRLGHSRRNMGEFSEAVEHHSDAGIAEGNRRRLRDAEILGMDQAEEREHGAGQREPGGLLQLAVDDEHRDGAQNDAGERGAAAERRQTFVKHALGYELVEAED